MLADNYKPIKDIADGVTTDFTFDWGYVSADSVKVYFEDEDGFQTLITTGYTLTAGTEAGGTIAFDEAPDNGFIIIARDTPDTQNTAYVTSKGFEAQVVEYQEYLLL